MTDIRLRLVLGSVAVASAAVLAGCGGSTFGRDSDGSAGQGATAEGGSSGSATGGSPSGGSGGSITGGSGGSGATGGSATGGSATGGSPSGGVGGSGGGGEPVGRCTIDEDCLAVMNTDDPCYSGDCSAPIWASVEDLAANHCLVPWELRHEFEGHPDCGLVDEPIGCPAICFMQPACVFPACVSGRCGGEMIYDPLECGAGGSGGTGGTGGGPADCESLNQAREAALNAAAACDPSINMPQCIEGFTVPDECGCDMPLNDSAELAERARATYEAWEAMGCGPLPCGRACPVGEFAGCAPGPDGSMGQCAYIASSEQ